MPDGHHAWGPPSWDHSGTAPDYTYQTVPGSSGGSQICGTNPDVPPPQDCFSRVIADDVGVERQHYEVFFGVSHSNHPHAHVGDGLDCIVPDSLASPRCAMCTTIPGISAVTFCCHRR